ncbi:flagellar biosynthesis anti-sigma factor FlgM [Humisphaera borealis]|uniref:Flagellar biosynthesis anti-sigma factor FlgM n=1 Tax=Humisphaera borealis TaxID=2807512 RepID=A0A7M2WPL6_9BACT|nr:flagellar biosynthesis anti-sigma factor FlgM [Humisphaera borealis]QOV87465.1 flagellar biosynthesis anti-sigma factor FlgM [Humisphaera borealis]
MSSVNNIGNTSPVYTVNRPGPRPVAAPATTSPARGTDTVELSSGAQVGGFMEILKAGGDVRTDKVAQIKAQIAAGTYDDDKKFDLATDRMLEDLLEG